jgi:hypothetical protein
MTCIITELVQNSKQIYSSNNIEINKDKDI